MKKRMAVRAAMLGVLLVLSALLVPLVANAANSEQIDTAAATDPSQCVPCHQDIGNVQAAGLKFSHGNHLLISCDGCHSRFPHRKDKTERVPMEVCFACHGITHGDQGELATGKCADCHTQSFRLRPSSHARSWADKPHADASRRTGINDCMMCHDAAKDCDVCHAAKAPQIPKMPAVYHSVIASLTRGPSIRIFPKGKVTMSQCIYCHSDIDSIVPGRLIFAHAEHLQRNFRCAACHPTFPHTTNAVERPDMQSCYRCHGLNHNSDGQVATQKCEACHPKEFELMPADHTSAFAAGGHKKRATSDPAYCAMCHASSFCVGCHQGRKVSPHATGKVVLPVTHKAATWQKEHGAGFLAGEGSCGSCHDDASCKRCHKTVMPHPVGWISDHRPEPGVSDEDCKICHTNRQKCQTCHHRKSISSELIAKNCVECHKEMKQTPATSIKQKAFAEHAVHFNVAVRSVAPNGKPKPRPYRCDDCHLGFGTLSSTASDHNATSNLEQASHDVTLCYSCHGSVDYQNELIAPFPGPQLCVRCHTNLDV